MANPKRRWSKTRQRKRNTHNKATSPSLSICPTTGIAHLSHHAFWHDNKLYYRGVIIMEGTAISKRIK